MKRHLDQADHPPLRLDDQSDWEYWNVQKSAPLMSLWRSPLTLPEFKILDAYLARIDSHHPEQRWVRFSKGELEELLGVKEIKSAELKQRLSHLGIMVNVEDPDLPQKFRAISLFERADCQRDADGTWQVDLECTVSAMQYIFNIEEIGYLRYKLHSVISIHSRFSYVLFLYLEQNCYRKVFEIDIKSLRALLGCVDTYPGYKRLNQQVLKRCQQELEEATDLRFTYEPLRRGRSVHAVRFRVESSKQLETIDAQSALPPGMRISAHENAVMAICCRSDGRTEFNQSQIKEIEAVLQSVKAQQAQPNFSELGYLRECYDALNQAAARGTVRNRFRYLLKILRNQNID